MAGSEGARGTPPGTQAGLLPEAPADDLDALFAGLDAADGLMLTVWRVGTGGQGRDQRLFAVSADQASVESLLDTLRDDYQGGEFRIRARKRGSSQWLGGQVVSVAPPPRRHASASSPALALAPVATAAPVPAAMPADMMGMMTMVVTMMKTLFEVVKPIATPPPPTAALSFSDVLSAAQILAGKKDDPLAMIDRVLSLREKLVESGGEGGGGANTNDLWLAGIKGLTTIAEKLPVATPVAAPAIGGPPASSSPAPAALPRQPAPGATAAAAPVVSPAAAPAAAAAPEPPELAQLRAIVVPLCKAADMGIPAESAAVQLLEQAQNDDAVLGFMEPENSIDSLAALFPDVVQRRAWFDALRLAVLAEFETVDDGDAPAPIGQGLPVDAGS